MSERSHLDPVARRFRRWVDEALVEDRALNPDEVADVDAAAQHAARETNRAVLYDRAQAAITANLNSLTTAQAIQGQASFNNTQRDDALRFLAGRVVDLTKQNNALIRLVVSTARSDALDSTE